jgi:hypothetical protein
VDTDKVDIALQQRDRQNSMLVAKSLSPSRVSPGQSHLESVVAQATTLTTISAPIALHVTFHSRYNRRHEISGFPSLTYDSIGVSRNDFVLLGTTVLLIIFGVMVIGSATARHRSDIINDVSDQILYAIIGITLVFGLAAVDYRLLGGLHLATCHGAAAPVGEGAWA